MNLGSQDLRDRVGDRRSSMAGDLASANMQDLTGDERR
jgi:hypothetical protein